VAYRCTQAKWTCDIKDWICVTLREFVLHCVCATMRIYSHPQASEGRHLSTRVYLWQLIVLEKELACGWLSERGRHSERPGPARASCSDPIWILFWFPTGTHWVLIRIRTESPSSASIHWFNLILISFAFITGNRNLEPLLEGLFAQIHPWIWVDVFSAGIEPGTCR